jgi:hypothetical protein
MRNKAIFLAFAGVPVEQTEHIFDIGHGYQSWDLRRVSRDEFITAIRQAIPSVNDNVLRNYKAEDSGDVRFGIAEVDFHNCSWGLLIPKVPAMVAC